MENSWKVQKRAVWISRQISTFSNQVKRRSWSLQWQKGMGYGFNSPPIHFSWVSRGIHVNGWQFWREWGRASIQKPKLTLPFVLCQLLPYKSWPIATQMLHFTRHLGKLFQRTWTAQTQSPKITRPSFCTWVSSCSCSSSSVKHCALSTS